jgi:hypothetical protein
MLATTLSYLEKFNASMDWLTVWKRYPKRVCHRGSACLVRVGMTAKRFDQTFAKFERRAVYGKSVRAVR